MDGDQEGGESPTISFKRRGMPSLPSMPTEPLGSPRNSRCSNHFGTSAPSLPTAVPRWADAIAAYESVSPLEPAERRLIDLLDAGGVIGGLEQWFRWILEEKIEFSSPVAALKRIDVLLEKLDFALDRTSRWLSDTD